MSELINLIKNSSLNDKGNPRNLIILEIIFSIPFISILLSDTEIKDIVLLSFFPEQTIKEFIISWLVILIIVLIIWYLLNRLPIISKKNSGIMMGLYGTCQETRYIVEHDINQIVDDAFKVLKIKKYKLVFLSEYYCKKIKSSEKSLNKITKRLKGKILYLGNCRSVNNDSSYVLEFIANIQYEDRVDESVKKILESRFRNKIKHKIKVLTENSYEGFRSLSNRIKIIIVYILGINSFFFDRLEESIDIFSYLLDELEGTNDKFENTIIKEVKTFISESYRKIVYLGYDTDTYSFEDNAFKYLTKSLEFNPNNHLAHELFSIYHFVENRNIKQSIFHNEKIQYPKASGWRFSRAFLEAYDGNIRKAHNIYIKIFKRFYIGKIDDEIIHFISYFDSIEEHFYLKYLLILLYEIRYGNTKVAKEYINECVELKEKVCSEDYDFFYSKVKELKLLEA